MTVQILPFYLEGQELTSGCKQENAQQSRNKTKQQSTSTWPREGGSNVSSWVQNTFDLKPKI